MTPGPRERVTELFEAALGRPAGERDDFLRRACDGDDTLLAEVRSLIAESERLGESGQATLPAGWRDQRETSVAITANLKQIGRYVVVRELGRGAMGIVFEARDPLIGRTVAIKTIRLDEFGAASEKKWLQERLFREARSAGALSHPGIVTIHDIGLHEDLAFIALEYVDGPTLESLMGDQLLDHAMVTDILRQAAAALDFANETGVVHRDVKPGNIMLHKGRTVKITDFGIAKITSTQQLTRTGMVMGTPSYMSPEQIRALPVDGRSDQFSLGVVAFEMLTGVKPFRADSLAALVHQIVYEDRPSARALNSSLCGDVDTVFHRVLAKAPEQRFRHCAELVEVLSEALKKSAAELEEKRRQEERTRKLESGLREVERFLESSELQAAESHLKVLGRDFDGEPQLLALADRIDQAKRDARMLERINEAIRESTTHIERREWQKAITVLNAIESERPGVAEIDLLREKALREQTKERERREYFAGLLRVKEHTSNLLGRDLIDEADSFLESQQERFGHEKDFDQAFDAVLEAKRSRRFREELPAVSISARDVGSNRRSEHNTDPASSIEAPVIRTLVSRVSRSKPRTTLLVGIAAAATITLVLVAYVALRRSSAPPQVLRFEAVPGTKNGSAILFWAIKNAREITIQPDVGYVRDTGSIAVSPSKSTKFVLTAKGLGGFVQADAFVTVEVKPPPDEIVDARPPEAHQTRDALAIHFTAIPAEVSPGDAVTLRWRVDGAAHVVIDPGIGVVRPTFSLQVHPWTTTTYTLTATTSGSTNQARATVEVRRSPPAAPVINKEGRIIWTGRLEPAQELRLIGETASNGSLVGALPGVPIDVEVHPTSLQVVRPPSGANDWKEMAIRNGGTQTESMIVIRWKSR